MNIVAVFLIGVSLSMDAFAVSICQGLVQMGKKAKEMEKIAFTFGFFQFAMTLLGGLAGSLIVPYVVRFKTIIPCIIFWGIAFFMFREGIASRKESCEAAKRLNGIKTLCLLGLATSIDALFIGITFAMQKGHPIFLSSLLIGCTTFVISAFGYYSGKKFSTISKHKAYYLGALLLFALGIPSFIGIF